VKKPEKSTEKKQAKPAAKKIAPAEKKKVEEPVNMSDFSELDDDEEPKKKKARKSKDTSPADSSNKEKVLSARSSTSSSSNGLESKLRKLKDLVILCGTRRAWKRLFEDAGCSVLMTAMPAKTSRKESQRVK
jgi:hypothetical protein